MLIFKGESTMSNTMQKDKEQGYIALYEELEARYGAALAQQIVDQIKKADKQDNRPEYMAVKAVSETLELFRGQTRQTLQKLKQVRLEDHLLVQMLSKKLTCWGFVYQSQKKHTF